MSAELLEVIVWPITVFVIFLILLCIFRKPIRKFIDNVVSVEFKGFKASSQDKTDAKEMETQFQADLENIRRKDVKWGNVANIYWLSHDIMWTIDKLIRDPKRDQIIHGLRQTSFHLSELNLEKVSYGIRIESLLENVECTIESDWDLKKRQNFVNELLQIIMGYAKIFENHQDDFQPRPEKL
jgi:hypothetical protein